MPTPPLPDWIRNATVRGYVPAHELCPNETRLYGTESLYGDWGGSLLVLAKDFAPSRIVRDRIAASEPRPYRHKPGMRTNRVLHRLAEPFEALGIVYGSALANLLRDDDRLSGTLPNRDAALDYGARVTRFAIEHMPNLRWIVCMGLEAWEAAADAEGERGDWQWHRDSGAPLGRLIAAYHPAARVSLAAMQRPWALLGERLALPT